MKSLRIAFLVGATSALASFQSLATPMGLGENPPDLTGGSMTVEYTNANDTFVATGSTVDYEPAGSLVDSGDYTLAATINGSGILTGGTISISGDVGSGVELLLSGQLETGSSGPSGAFGFVNPHGGAELGDYNIFEFLFVVNGGALAGDFGGNGAIGGMILDAQFDSVTDFAGNWNSDFSSLSQNAVANTFFVEAVPEPSSILLISLGLGLGVVSRRRASAFFSNRKQ